MNLATLGAWLSNRHRSTTSLSPTPSRAHAAQSNLHGLEGGAAAFSKTTRSHVGNSYSNPGYGHGGWRHGYWGRYGVYGYGGDSYAQGDGCYYVYAYRRHVYRRVLVCSSN